MKNKMGIKEKLKVCLMFLKSGNYNIALIEICPNCRSVKIICESSREQKIIDGSTYQAKYKCLNCGSECIVDETWIYNK